MFMSSLSELVPVSLPPLLPPQLSPGGGEIMERIKGNMLVLLKKKIKVVCDRIPVKRRAKQDLREDATYFRPELVCQKNSSI